MSSEKYFKFPKITGQKQYEALRAFYLEGIPGNEVARRFGYTYAAFNTLKQRFKSGQIKFFFTPPTGPGSSRISKDDRDKIIEYRKKGLSVPEIVTVLETIGIIIGNSSVGRILDQEGFPKLARRTQLKIGITKDNTILPDIAQNLILKTLDDWSGECAVGGIFLFAPIIEHYGLTKIIQNIKLPGTNKIDNVGYILSMLALKLVGKERLGQINDYNFDRGLGLFAGLNVLPKSTAISTYSFRLNQKDVRNFLFQFVKAQNKIKTYSGNTINLDYHTIQHYGDESTLETHWAGARGKRVKGVLTLIAQDGDSRCQLYVDTDIKRSEADDKILDFVAFWKKIRGKFNHTLIFDSKLTNYHNLSLLASDHIKFITLRRRGKKLVEDANKIPASEWKKIRIDTIRRKFKNPMIHDSIVVLRENNLKVRQLIMKGNGHEDPAFFITNDYKSSAKDIVTRYTKRWNIENSIEEAISFFNINSLSSPILIKVHLDVVLTMIADTLYYHLAQSLRGFETCDSSKIFRHFINMPADIEVTKKEILLKFPLRAHSPVLRSAGLDKWTKPISWLGHRKIKFQWG
jgi:transposase